MGSLDEHILRSYGGININCLQNVLQSNDIEIEQNIYIQLIKHSHYIDMENLITTMNPHGNKLSILSSNIESINAKFNELELFVEDLRTQNIEFNVICLQECWLSENDDLSLCQLKGYTCLHQSKSCSNKGGVNIYLHEFF